MKRALLPFVILLTMVLLFSGGQAWAQFTPSNHVSFTLEGCRNNGTITLPIGGQFICPDAAYTTGNLGKGWNELDLVPHRLTTQVGTQSSATTDYSVLVAGDYQTSGRIGWDVITVPLVNAGKSDASCSVAAGPQSTDGTPQNPFGGGTDVAIYRQLNIHQNKGTTCVFDYVQRLALGAHLYPGSSLQSYMFESQDFSTGKKTISIPVNEILPQSISKDMSATQGSDHTWTASKDPSPATVSFADTCNLSNPASTGVQITVQWTKLAAVPGGPITVVTLVSATNPAARSITVNVTDVIYSGTTPLDTSGPTSTAVPANTTNYPVLTHTTTVPAGTTNLNDIATATYTDTATGVPVPGNTQATASADVQLSGPELNNSATINDTESLGGGNGFLFSADSFTPAVGAFDSPYIAGTKTEGPVGWTSNSQSGSGSVTFNKTIYVSQGNANSDTLSDTATLNGVDGFTTSAGASINISAHAKVSLTIDKSLNVGLPFASQTFTFHVKDAQDNEVTGSPVTITLTSGETSGSTSIGNLEPGTYTVTEDEVAGFTSDSPQQATITLPSCSGSVTIHNTLQGKDLTVEKTATPSFSREYKWTITKSVDQTNVTSVDPVDFHYSVKVDQTGIVDSGWTVTGNITVKNPNPWAIAGVNVGDVVDNGGTCAVTGGSNITIAASSQAVLPYTCTYSSAPSSSSGTNSATATWDSTAALTPDGSANGTAHFAFDTPTSTTNKTIHVTDTYAGALGTLTGVDDSPWTTHTYTYTRTLTPTPGVCTDYDNTGAITETGQNSSVTVTLCGPKPLTVTKTAVPAFNRQYLWTIQKSVDKTNVTSSIPVVFNYSVLVNQTGIQDSGWNVTGNITVANPNAWAVTGINITDAISNGGTCSVTNGTNVSIAANSQVVRAYTCTYTGTPASMSGSNTATATWTTNQLPPSGSASSAPVAFAFTTPTSTTNKVIHVTDSYAGALGTVTGVDASPWATQTFTYSRTINPVLGACQSYNNTATITETGQNSSVTVTVCGPSNNGALTMGFWQNKNGQGIIKTGLSTAGVCNVGTWLRSFAPYQDLSPTANCSVVAAYVYNVIKAANSSGATMNAMLKAQMLATALDVYFSDGTLGGNRIGAPGPVGAFLVDLTKVCTVASMPCPAYENSGPAFGGATSMTVYQMIVFASTQSNVGGSLWYGNNKYIQELAKDAFDAINNRVALNP